MPFVEAEDNVLESTRKAARASLAKYPGRRKDTKGRPYLSFSDYSAWKGRSVKGKLEDNLSYGILSSNWNLWLDKDGGMLAGVKAGRIESYIEDYGFTVHPDEEVEQKLKDRNKLLSSLRAHTLHDFDRDEGYFARIPPYERKSYKDRVLEWKQLARAFMEEIYVLQLCIESISQRYFEGRPVLFPDMDGRLDILLKGWEGLVEWYNDTIATDIEEHWKSSDASSPFPLDAELVKEQAHEQLPERIAYLVDNAKADTLRALGEHDAASDLMEKHLTDDDDRRWVRPIE